CGGPGRSGCRNVDVGFIVQGISLFVLHCKHNMVFPCRRRVGNIYMLMELHFGLTVVSFGIVVFKIPFQLAGPGGKTMGMDVHIYLVDAMYGIDREFGMEITATDHRFTDRYPA